MKKTIMILLAFDLSLATDRLLIIFCILATPIWTEWYLTCPITRGKNKKGLETGRLDQFSGTGNGHVNPCQDCVRLAVL